MKEIFFLGLLFCTATCCQGQTWNEWVHQKKTQTKYLLEQISALQLYTGYLEKGYAIARKGLASISEIKQGELTLHRDFFQGMETVKPVIADDPRVTEILTLSKEVLLSARQTKAFADQCGELHEAEITHIRAVAAELEEGSRTLLGALQTVNSRDQLEMTDAQRLQRIQSLYQKMRSMDDFSKNFRKETLLLAIQRDREKNDLKTSRVLYEGSTKIP